MTKIFSFQAIDKGWSTNIKMLENKNYLQVFIFSFNQFSGLLKKHIEHDIQLP